MPYAEILRRLIAYLQKRFPGVAIGPQTNIRRLFEQENSSAWSRLASDINKLGWVQRRRMTVSKSSRYRTPADLAKLLFRKEEASSLDLKRGRVRKAKKAARKVARKGVVSGGPRRYKRGRTRVPKVRWHRLVHAFPGDDAPFLGDPFDFGDPFELPKGPARKPRATLDSRRGRVRKAKKARKVAKKGEVSGTPFRYRSGRTVPKVRHRVVDTFQSELPKEPARKSPAASTETDEQTRNNLNYTLWYGTNRQPNDAQDFSKGFSGNRETKVHLGVCKVHVPESHKIGSTGSTWWKRFWSGVDDRLKLTSIEQFPAEKFWRGVSSQLKKLRVSDRDAVIFVHGYNVSFEDAALRAAQLGTDLAVRGCMAFFSWPSKGKKRGYPADEASIEASEPFITQFMIDFAQNSGASKIHIIAHSMGNRGVLRAVNRIASTAARSTGKPFDQIILAAPDVDADTFRDLCKAYTQVSRRTTLYVSSRDRAVEAAQWLHGFARAGLEPPITIAPKIDTVNVTNADLTMLGHGYVAESRGVLTDIHELLRFGAPPSKRFGLQRQKSDDGKTYWLIGK